ncbi:hypothetical protein FACS1894110_10220 [Spirochaetia bacterium]|nr:hypothetical protein FACS1894110_10220 [Spirochaetia bacterium]
MTNPAETTIADKPREWLSYAEAASEIHVHKETIGRWVRAGKIKVSRFSKKAVYIKRSDLYRAFEEAAQNPG